MINPYIGAISFLAGILTVFSPCVFTLLPIILSGGISDTNKKLKPFVIIFSLCFSIVVFSLVVHSSTFFINSKELINFLSGGIILFFGIISILPEIWDGISFKLGFSLNSQNLLNNANQKNSFLGDVLVGASLGPVFTSCSPTYLLIVGTILQENIFSAIFYLFLYAIGLGVILFVISMGGQSFVQKMKWVSYPNGILKRSLGIIFIILGWSIIFSVDKQIQSYLVESGSFLNLTSIEEYFISGLK